MVTRNTVLTKYLIRYTPTITLEQQWTATKYDQVCTSKLMVTLQHCDVNYLIKYSWLLMTHPLWRLDFVYDGQFHIMSCTCIVSRKVIQLSNQIFMIIDDTPTIEWFMSRAHSIKVIASQQGYTLYRTLGTPYKEWYMYRAHSQPSKLYNILNALAFHIRSAHSQPARLYNV